MQSFQHHMSVIDERGRGEGAYRFLWATLCGYHKSLGSIVDWATSFGHLCVCVGQINISLDPGNLMRLGYSDMQSSCALQFGGFMATDSIGKFSGQRKNQN